MSNLMGRVAIALTAVSLAVAVTAGCVLANKPNAGSKSPEPGETLSQSADALKPQAVPYTKANLIYQGSVVPVDVRADDDGKNLNIKLMVADETSATEKYAYDSSGFRFVGTDAETYDPPIPLVHYPLVADAPWHWAGTIRLGDQSYPAEADIKAKAEDLNITAGHFNTYLVEVELSFDGGAPEKSKRRLRFWFDPGKGVVKREFGLNSSREPRLNSGASDD